MINLIKKIVPKTIKKSIRHHIDKIKFKPMYKRMTEERISYSKKPRFILFGTPDSKNLGDHAIAEAELEFMKEFFPKKEYIEFSLLHYIYDFNNIKKYVNKDDIILVHGGGFLGNLWIEAELMFRDILKSFPDNKVIVMPQTIYFDERFNKEEELRNSQKSYNLHDNLTLFLREQQSYDFVKEHFDEKVNPKLIPDIVTSLEYNSNNTERKDVLMVFRTDKEKLNHSKYTRLIENTIKNRGIKLNYTDTVITEEVNESNREEVLKEKFEEFNRHKLIITDRLHGMIFSLITGTPCIAFDNSSGKVSGVYKWLKEFDYIYCIDKNKEYSIDDFSEIIDRLLNYNDYGYDRKSIIKNFGPLIEELNKIKN